MAWLRPGTARGRREVLRGQFYACGVSEVAHAQVGHRDPGVRGQHARGTRVEQRAQQHVARETRNRVEPSDHRLTVRARAMRCAAIAAPNPESMFTTVMPAAQEACMASSAVIPSKLAS